MDSYVKGSKVSIQLFTFPAVMWSGYGYYLNPDWLSINYTDVLGRASLFEIYQFHVLLFFEDTYKSTYHSLVFNWVWIIQSHTWDQTKFEGMDSCVKCTVMLN